MLRRLPDRLQSPRFPLYTQAAGYALLEPVWGTLPVVAERGQALIEAIVATAIATILVGAVLAGLVAANAHFGPDPAREALDSALAREMSIARNIVKYQGTTLAPATVATSVPLPNGSPLPATLELQSTPLPGGGMQITITAAATWNNTAENRSLITTLLAPAPLPGSSIALPGLAPAPTGAP